MTLYTYNATIVRWVDGDTVWLNVDLGFRTVTTTDFRLYGLDTPERGQAGYQEAKDAVNVWAPVGTLVTIKTYKNPDKYGRWLVEVWHEGECVNSLLVSEGLALPYFGGTK